MIEKLIGKLRARDDISDAEARALADAVEAKRDFKARDILVRAGERMNDSFILLDGVVCRFKDTKAGERQILELDVPGDFIDLHNFTLKRLDHDIMALTKGSIAAVPHERLKKVVADFPHLGRVLWFLTNLDAAIHREWILNLGRRSAIQRLGQLFLELDARLNVAGLSHENSFDFPLSQQTVADCLGLTPVHLNRMLKELREEGLVTFRRAKVTIQDWEGLAKLSDFNPGYLYLERDSE